MIFSHINPGSKYLAQKFAAIYYLCPL